MDEVGRGALAGPVCVAAVLVTHDYFLKSQIILKGIKDSKELSSIDRLKWFNRFKSTKEFKYNVSFVSSKIIDQINISRAANLAASRLYKKLNPLNKKIFVSLDYGLKMKSGINYEAKIKGDSLVPIISAASIIAKVTRDKYMAKIGKNLPAYNFADNKGYGTKSHIKALRNHGPSIHHRKSFLKRFNKVELL